MSDSELGEAFAVLREINKKKRKDNQRSSTALLKLREVEFEEKNGGKHLVVKGVNELIDFWPSTGLFIARKTERRGRGVFRLLKMIAKDRELSSDTQIQRQEST